MTASLVLQDGTSFSGQLFGARKPVAGEVVFNTGMVGYTESLTDPSYRGQILALTYPLVGNYGVPEHLQSEKIQISALVVSELVSEYSHSMARKSLPQWLEEQGIPCLAGIDTRALTRRLRSHGCMLGKIVVDEAEVEFDDPNRGDLVAEVGPERRAELPNACGFGEHVLPADAVAISSTARNFKGRMGSPASQVYLASPYTVAASAVAGRIADPRELLQ